MLLARADQLTNAYRPSDQPFTIGANPQGQDAFSDFFQGLVDEVRISKVARYDQDFTPARRFAPDADTIALFHCDEGSREELRDASGNGHHGKIVGATWVQPSQASVTGAMLPAQTPLLFDGDDLVEVQNIPWGHLEHFTLEAFARADVIGKVGFIVDRSRTRRSIATRTALNSP